MTVSGQERPLYEDEESLQQQRDALDRSLEALGVSRQDALDFHYGINDEIQNPSVPVEGIASYYNYSDAIANINPDFTADQQESLLALYTAGGRADHLYIKVPQQGRYAKAIEDNNAALERFYDDLPDEFADAFLNDFGTAPGNAEGLIFQNRLVDNLGRLDAGETISVRPLNYEIQGAQAPADVRYPDFENKDLYLRYELNQVRQTFPGLENFDNPELLTRYADLKYRERFLGTATAENFEALDGNLKLASGLAFIEAIATPGREGLDFINHLSDDTPAEQEMLLRTIDPRINNIADLQETYRILFGRARFSFNSEDLESFGISGSDLGEAILDPLNLIPLPVIDDLARVGLRVPLTAARASGRVIRAGLERGLDVARGIAGRIPTGGLERLRQLARGLVIEAEAGYFPDPTPLDEDSVTSIRNSLEPDAFGLNQGRDVVAPEFTSNITSQLGQRVRAGVDQAIEVTDDVRRAIRGAFSRSERRAPVQREEFDALVGILPEARQQILQRRFGQSGQDWREAAGRRFAQGQFRRESTLVQYAFEDIAHISNRIRDTFQSKAFTNADDAIRYLETGRLPRTSGARAGSTVNLSHPQANRDLDELGQAAFEVRELDDLITSHQFNGTFLSRTPEYPAQYQPRTRDDSLSVNQVIDISGNLKPELLINNSSFIGDGTPIVTRDGILLAGNGRTIALKRALDTGKFQPYLDTLKGNLGAYGLSDDALEGLTAPVLVRVSNDPARYDTIARLSNVSSVSAVQSTDAVASAIKNVDAPLIERVSDFIFGRQNEEGTRKISDILLAQGTQEELRPFIRKIIPTADYARYFAPEGGLNEEGIRYVVSALEALAFDLTDDAQRLFFDRFALGTGQITEALKNIKQGLLPALPELLYLRSQVLKGAVPAKFDLAPQLARASNWLYDRLIQPDYNRDRLFLEINNLEFGNPLDTPAYRHVAITIAINARSGRAISQNINRYVQAIRRTAPSLPGFSDESISILTLSEVWQKSFRESTTATLVPKQQEALELIYGRALKAAGVEDGGRIPKTKLAEEVDPTASISGDKSIAHTDEEVAKVYGTSTEEQAVTRQAVGAPPDRTSQIEAKVNPEDTAPQASKKVIRALNRGDITVDQAKDILKFKNIDAALLDQLKRNTPPGARVVTTPAVLDANIASDISSFADFVPQDELNTSVGALSRAIGIGVTDLAGVERFNTRIQGVIDSLPRDKYGIADALAQIPRYLGLSKTHAQLLTQGVTQRTDGFYDRIQLLVRNRDKIINNTAKNLGIDFTNESVSYRIYGALDRGNSITSQEYERLLPKEKVIYKLIREYVAERESWAMDIAQSILSDVVPTEHLSKSLEGFRQNFLRNDWFARNFVDPNDPKKGILNRSQAQEFAFTYAPSLRARQTDATFDEIVASGLVPAELNPVVALSDSNVSLLSAAQEAAVLRAYGKIGVITDSPNTLTGSPASVVGLEDQRALIERSDFQTVGLPNSDTYELGRLPLNENPLLLRMQNAIDNTFGAGTYQVKIPDEYYITKFGRQMLDVYYKTAESPTLLKKISGLSRGLKLVKLSLSLFQLWDYAVFRAPFVFFYPSRENFFGAKGLYNYPLFLGRLGLGLVAPDIGRVVQRVSREGSIPHRVGERLAGLDLGEFVRDAQSGVRPVKLYDYQDAQKGNVEIFVDQIAGTFNAPTEIQQLRIQPFEALNQKYDEIGHLVQDYARAHGLPRPVGTAAQAGVRATKLVHKGFAMYNRLVQERLFDGVAGYLRLQYFTVNGASQARRAAQQGLPVEEFINRLGAQSNYFLTSQRYWQSIYNTALKRDLASIFVFSSEPEGFAKMGLWMIEGMMRLVIPGLKRNETDAFAQAMIAGLLFFYGFAHVAHGATHLIEDGEWQWLPSDRRLPFRLNEYSPFGVELNRSFLAFDLPVQTAHGNARFGAWGPWDALGAFALDPLRAAYSRASSLVRTGGDIISSSNFYGDRLDTIGKQAENFVNNILPIPASDIQGRERDGPVLDAIERGTGFNLITPTSREGQTNEVQRWVEQNNLGDTYAVLPEDYFGLSLQHRREFEFSQPYLETSTRVAEDEFSNHDQGSSPNLRFRALVADARNVYDSYDATAQLYFKLFDPANSASQFSEWNEFLNALRDSTSTRITTYQVLYDDTYSNAQSGQAGGAAPKDESERLLYEYFDVIDASSHSTITGRGFNEDLFGENLALWLDDSTPIQRAAKEKVIADWRNAWPIPDFVRRTQDIIYTAFERGQTNRQSTHRVRSYIREEIARLIVDENIFQPSIQRLLFAGTLNENFLDEYSRQLRGNFDSTLIRLGSPDYSPLDTAEERTEEPTASTN